MKRQEILTALTDMEAFLADFKQYVETVSSFDADEIIGWSEKAARLGIGGIPQEFIRQCHTQFSLAIE